MELQGQVPGTYEDPLKIFSGSLPLWLAGIRRPRNRIAWGGGNVTLFVIAFAGALMRLSLHTHTLTHTITYTFTCL